MFIDLVEEGPVVGREKIILEEDCLNRGSEANGDEGLYPFMKDLQDPQDDGLDDS